jgi:hypothetical protein
MSFYETPMIEIYINYKYIYVLITHSHFYNLFDLNVTYLV